jgi:hypothetical protein
LSFLLMPAAYSGKWQLPAMQGTPLQQFPDTVQVWP